MRLRCASSFSPEFDATRAIKYLALAAGLLSYYAGEYSYVFSLFSSVFAVAFIRTIEIRALVVLGMLVSFFVIRILLYADFLYETIRDLRFFWGFFVFLLYFSSESHAGRLKNINYAPFFRAMIDLLLILLLIEFLTSNIFAFQWPNRQHTFFSELEMGIARGYGFGGNATVTSVLFIALSAVFFKNPLRDIFVLGMATSGTGAAIFLAKQLARTRNFLLVLTILVLAAVFVRYSKEIADYSGLWTLDKISLDYFIYIFSLKWSQIVDVFHTQPDWIAWIIGQPFELIGKRAGDFQALDYFVFNGLAGVVLLIAVLALFVNRFNILPVVLLLAGSIHYQVAFSIPGQIILAWLLSLKADVGDLKSFGLRQRPGFGAAKLAAHHQVI